MDLKEEEKNGVVSSWMKINGTFDSSDVLKLIDTKNFTLHCGLK